MTGPEHFAAAERCIQQAYEASDDADAQFHLAEAQVHATLAQASSAALKVVRGINIGDDAAIAAIKEWRPIVTAPQVVAS